MYTMAESDMIKIENEVWIVTGSICGYLQSHEGISFISQYLHRIVLETIVERPTVVYTYDQLNLCKVK
jgi:hypothetical protein